MKNVTADELQEYMGRLGGGKLTRNNHRRVIVGLFNHAKDQGWLDKTQDTAAEALNVAKVTLVERQGEGGFARVTLAPASTADGVRHVLVLEPLSAQLPPRPEPAPEVMAKPGRARKAGVGSAGVAP